MIRQIPIHELAQFLGNPHNGALLNTGVGSMGHRITVADVIQLLHSGHMQLWAAENVSRETLAVMLSEIVAYPRMNVLRLFGLAGVNIKQIAKFLQIVKAWALENGCAEIEAVETRPGLEVIIPEFKRAGVCLVMPIALQEEKVA